MSTKDLIKRMDETLKRLDDIQEFQLKLFNEIIKLKEEKNAQSDKK